MSDMLKYGVTFVKKNKRYPSLLDLASAGITRAEIRTEYGNLEGYKSALSTEIDKYICDLDRHTVSMVPKKSTKTFVITTAVAGADVDENFFKNLKAYCKDFNAELLIMISLNKSSDSLVVPSILKEETFILSDTNLNSNVFILGLKNTAATVDPITGLPRVGQRNGTFICASPKQRLKYVATGPNSLPHALMSTGAITTTNYIKSRNLITKSAYMADDDHIMGAIVVELDKDEMFHFRQIQAAKDGSFVELGDLYTKGKKRKLAPEAFVLGDWHSGESDPQAVQVWKDVTTLTKAKSWVIHDGFSGNSVSHHTEGKHIIKAKMAASGELSLEKELNGYLTDLTMMSKLVDKIVIVKSNHDDFLERYLDEARYVEDAHNHRLALELAAAMLDGVPPIKYYIDTRGKLDAEQFIWLGRDEDYSVAGIQLGAHGDKGANGARGSAPSLEAAYGECVYGHSHTPEILRGAFCVGTTSHLKLSYNSGPSSWFQTSCLVYPNGQRQLINNINGRFTNRK